jgi:nucleotide-binding universal stress UspA family protein
MVKCPVCGAHVPAEVAVEIPAAGGVRRYCSLRCAIEEQSEPPAPPAALPALPRRILVAVDGSGPSLRAVALAASLARATHAAVSLFHAVNPRRLHWMSGAGAAAGATRLDLRSEAVERELCRDAEAQLAHCRPVCEAAGVPVTAHVEVAQPLRALARAAEEADLVVIGSRGLDAFSGAALGSLSQRVISEIRKPVLVVH